MELSHLIGGAERRRQERRPLRTNAMLRIPGAPPVEVRTLDISVGGLAVVAPVNPQAGTLCTIVVAPPSQTRGPVTIELAATIVHSIFSSREGGFMIGLQYGELSPAAVEAVTRFLNQ